jgi:hypothetical protein
VRKEKKNYENAEEIAQYCLNMRCGVLLFFKELNIGTVQITDLSKHTSEKIV